MMKIIIMLDIKIHIVIFFGNRVYKCDEIFSVKCDLRCKNSSNNRSKKDNKIRSENSSSKFF